MADVALSGKATATPAAGDALIGVDVSVPDGIRRFPLSSDFRFGRIGVGVDPVHRIHMVSSGAAEKDLFVSHTIGNGTGLAATYRPVDIDAFYTATDLAANTLAWSGIRSGVIFGQNAAAAVGTVHNVTADMIVSGAGNLSNEYAPFFSVLRFDIGTGFTQTAGPTGKGWLTDFNIHGPVGVQPDLLNGITLLYNNYYNGSPSNSPAAAIWLVTRQGTGGGRTATHEAASTYPIDVALGIVGDSNAGASAIGWTTAIQIGGFGSAWKTSGASRIGTAIDISDYLTFGIKLTRHASGTGPAIAVAASSGPILIGATTAQFSTTLLEVVLGATADPLVYIGSVSGSFSHTMQLRNGAGTAKFFVSGGVNAVLTGTVAGDTGVAATVSGKAFHLGGTTKIVTVTQANTLGFFGATPIAQAVLATGAGATVDNVITALQNLGLVKQA